MNISEVCFSKSWGGLEMKCLEDAELLRECGHRLYPIVLPETKLDSEFEDKGFEPYTIQVGKYFSPLASLKIYRYLVKHKIDAIHCHQAIDLGPMLLAADLAKLRARVFTLRMESDKDKKDPYHRWIYSRISMMLTITQRMRDLVIRHRPILPERVRCLYNALDMNKIEAAKHPCETIRKRWNLSEQDFVVGIVGRLDPLKGQSVLIKACSRLTDKIPNLKLLIVGDETANEPGELSKLKALAQKLGIDRQVIFTGHISPTGRIVPAFDVSVMATRKETFGNVAVESCAMGIATIVTNAGGAPEIVEHEKTGLTVTPDDPDSFAQAIYRLYADPQQRKTLAKSGQTYVQNKFSKEKHLQGLVEALNTNL